MKSNFDYESRVFGLGKARTLPWYLTALKLKYALKSLKGIKGKVIDIGCGAGVMAKAIKYYRPDLEVYGGDVSQKALNQARKKPAKVKFVQLDVFKPALKKNSLSAVLSFDTFEHLEKLDLALKQVKKVLKKGGIFHLAIPYEASLFNLEGWLTLFDWKPKEYYCGHINKFKLNTLERLIEKQGFVLKERKYTAHCLYQLADIIFFSLVGLRKKSFNYQVEGFVKEQKGGLRNLVLIMKNIFAFLTYVESSVLFWFPGLMGHLTYEKK